MSDSVRPHRQQPTRLPRPWDSPGKNTGVGCHCLLQCAKVKSESEVAQPSPTLSDPMDCSPPGSSVHGILQARALERAAMAFSLMENRYMYAYCWIPMLFTWNYHHMLLEYTPIQNKMLKKEAALKRNSTSFYYTWYIINIIIIKQICYKHYNTIYHVIYYSIIYVCHIIHKYNVMCVMLHNIT